MPSDLPLRPNSSSPGRTRRTLLDRLAAELRDHGRRALVALSETDHPVLYVGRDDGGMTAVVAVQIGNGWSFLWGRRGQSSAASVEMAAHCLAALGQTRRRRLFAARPRPRGGLTAVA